MKALCSLFLCRGRGEATVRDRDDSFHGRGKPKEGLQTADGRVEAKRADESKHGRTHSGCKDSDSGTRQTPSTSARKCCGGDAGQTEVTVEALNGNVVLAANLLRNERTLRALLHKAKQVLTERSGLSQQEQRATLTQDQVSCASCIKASGDPELARLNTQLLETCNTPRLDSRGLLRLELLLCDLRRWLAARACPSAATALLFTAGDGLAHAEHAVRSGGLVRYWQPDNVTVFQALLQLYADLLQQAGRAARHQQQQQQQRQPKQQQQAAAGKARGSPRNDVTGLEADQSSAAAVAAAGESPLPMQASEQSVELLDPGLLGGRAAAAAGAANGAPHQQQQHPLTFAMAALMLRPDWLDLLSEVLELLHFSTEYGTAAQRAGREPQQALATALQLWGFLTQLVKFAAAYADSVQRMAACLQRLAALLTPPSGAIPRLLGLPMAEDTLVAQLHVLWLLQVLYDMPDAKVLYFPGLAEHYVTLHHKAMTGYYEASAADPFSASAELCRIHATLLRSLARHPGQPVRSTFATARTVEWILQEVSLESQLLPAASLGDAVDDGPAGESDEDGEDEDLDESDLEDSDERTTDSEGGGDGEGGRNAREGDEGTATGSPSEGGVSGSGQAGAAGGGAAVPRGASKAFEFTYDLNEDVERLIAMEDEMGKEMELDGFEYDEEGKQLKARSDALQAAAAAEAAATAAAAATMPSAPKQSTQQTAGGTEEEAAATAVAGARRMMSQDSWGLNSPGQRSNGVPRLALASLRTCSISSMATHTQSPTVGRRPTGQRTSGTDTTLGGASARLEEQTEGEDDSDDDELARSRTPHLIVAAAAAERVACWSSSLAEAYRAAANGDASKVPYPPPRSQSNGNAGPLALNAAVIQQPRSPPEGASRPRELTSGSPVHAGPQGELHIMVQTTGTGGAGGSARAGQQPHSASAHGRPPLPTKPALPPLKVAAVAAAAGADAGLGAVAQSPTSSARAPPAGSSRAMVVLSASNRAHQGAWAQSPSGSTQAQQQQPAPSAQQSQQHPSVSPVRNLSRQFSATGSEQAPAPQPITTAAAAAPGESAAAALTASGDVGEEQVAGGAGPAGAPPIGNSSSSGGGRAGDEGALPRRPLQPLIPALNLKSLRRRDGATDTGRTVPLSSMLRTTNGGSISNCSGMDSANTLLPTGSTNVSCGDGAAGGSSGRGLLGSSVLERIAEGEPAPPPPEVSYQEQACRRLLYQDRATHILLLKTLMDLLVAPSGALDHAYVPQYPAHHSVPHAEYTLLWHLNAPRNTGVVHDLFRGAQRRAQQSAAAAATIAAPGGMHGGAGAAGQLPQAGILPGGMVGACVSSVTSSESGMSVTAPVPPGGASAAAAAQSGPVAVPRSPSRAPLKQTDSARDYPAASAVNPSPSPRQGLTTAVTTTAGLTTTPTTATAAGAVAVAPAAAPPGGGSAAELAAVAAPAAGRAVAITRALQLLSRPLFDADRYSNLQFVARGAYGYIYRARMDPPRAHAWPSPSLASAGTAAQTAPMQVVIKTIQLPTSPADSCMLADVFGEVSVMERFTGHECICQLLDYGMRDDAYWIVMRRYRCSLAEWRARQRPLADLLPTATAGPAGSASPSPRAAEGTVPAIGSTPPTGAAGIATAAAATAARVYLSALLQVVDALRLLASQHVVHFDLKCSNVLIEPLPGVRDGELWAPVGAAATATATAAGGAAGAKQGAEVPFRCVLGDFGEARAYRCAEEAFTARNRGTEVFKSPEMLMLNVGGVQQPQPVPSPRRSPSLPVTASPGRAAASSPRPGGPPSSRPTSAAARQPQLLPPSQSLAGAGLASDVWSLGCLAYELLSGTVLFSGDYASVTHRVAFGSGDRLVLTAAERARLGGLPQLVELVEWILVRDPAKRPSLDRIRARIDQLRAELTTATVV